MPSAHISEHLANERTFLAFLRTAISLLTFGISINRFSLFLIQQQKLEHGRVMFGMVRAEQAGLGMILAGAVLMVFALVRFQSTGRSIEAQTFSPKTGFAVVASAIIVLSSITALWLFRT